MSIPGLTPELPLRAKVRTGEKVERARRDGTKYTRPVALDHFICDDPEFEAHAGEKPSTFQIRFPYESAAECFPSGLEKWAVSQSGKALLLCFTKGDGVAHGLGGRLDDADATQLNPREDRQDFACKAQACRFYGKEKHQGCQPMARLNFLLPDGPRGGVFRWETKSLHSIRAIQATLDQYPDLRVPTFRLTLSRIGQRDFPIVTISEDASPAAPVADAPAAPGLAAVDAPADEAGEAVPDYRLACRSALEQLGQWPPSDAVVAWIGDVGYEAAAAALERRVAGDA